MSNAKLFITLPWGNIPWGEEERDRMTAEGGMWDRREVAADANVNRLALLYCRGDGSIDLFMRIFQVVHHSLRYMNKEHNTLAKGSE